MGRGKVTARLPPSTFLTLVFFCRFHPLIVSGLLDSAAGETFIEERFILRFQTRGLTSFLTGHRAALDRIVRCPARFHPG